MTDPANVPVKAKPASPARMTVVETVYHADARGPTDLPGLGFSRALSSDEQPYLRRIAVGEEWQPLDVGWVHHPAHVVVKNHAGEGLQRVPTNEQRAEIAAKVVLLAFSEHDAGAWVIPPGESFRGTPSTPRMLIRCMNGEAKVTVLVIPE